VVDEIDGQDMGMWPTGSVTIIPGAHTISFRIKVLLLNGAATTYRTLELNAEAGHTYKVHVDGPTGDTRKIWVWIVDENTDQIVSRHNGYQNNINIQKIYLQ
jgi:hypothetical protein